jgi:long-chain fatty acid transport protein
MRLSHQVKRFWLVTGASICLATASNAFGGAFEVLQQGTRASGQAEAFVAQADDPSAIWYNPAGLTQLHGTNAIIGAYVVVPDYHFKAPNGATSSNHQVSELPTIYAESDFGTENWRFGLGMNNVYGLREDYGKDGPLQYLFTRGHLYTINIEPTVAYKANEHLSFGVGFNIYAGSADLEHSQLLGAPPTPVGYLKLGGSDIAFGVSPSLMWKIDDRNQVGVFYHSPATLHLGGMTSIHANGIPTIGPSPTNAGIELPQTAGIGYAFHPIDRLKIETDAVWSNWGALQGILIQSKNPVFNNQLIPTKYHDTWAFRLGTQYALNDHWTARAGYQYGTSAAPAATFSPLVPDSNYHLFSAGLGYAQDNWSVDGAYVFILRETRNITDSINAAADGKWNTNMQGFMVSFGVKI